MSGVRITYTGAVNLGMLLAGVKAGTVEQWITRGLITKHPDGYDPDEIMLWVENRDREALRVQAGIKRDTPNPRVA